MSPVYTRENRHSQRTAIQWLPEVNLIVSLSFKVTRSLYLAHRFLRNHGLTKWPLHFVTLALIELFLKRANRNSIRWHFATLATGHWLL